MYILHARLKLHYGQLGPFCETMAKIVPMLEARGWTLVSSASTIFGDLHEVHDLWEINDANVVGEGLNSLFLDPEFLAIAPELASQIKQETLSLMVKTSFSP